MRLAAAADFEDARIDRPPPARRVRPLLVQVPAFWAAASVLALRLPWHRGLLWCVMSRVVRVWLLPMLVVRLTRRRMLVLLVVLLVLGVGILRWMVVPRRLGWPWIVRLRLRVKRLAMLIGRNSSCSSPSPEM